MLLARQDPALAAIRAGQERGLKKAARTGFSGKLQSRNGYPRLWIVGSTGHCTEPYDDLDTQGESSILGFAESIRTVPYSYRTVAIQDSYGAVQRPYSLAGPRGTNGNGKTTKLPRNHTENCAKYARNTPKNTIEGL